MRAHASRAMIVGIAGVGLLVAGVPQAQAQDGYGGYRGRHGASAPSFVTAHSRWGNGSISAPVRPGPRGYQVRLPGGTWVDCARNCSDTLRVQTVDFWQNQGGPQAKDGGPGYLQWHFRF